MTEAIEIYCDEAGYTGTSLLDPEQLYFAFSSVALTNKEAEEIISNARSRHPVQLPELKAAVDFSILWPKFQQFTPWISGPETISPGNQ